MSWIVRSWTDVENNIVSVERVKEYIDTPKEVQVYINSLGPKCFCVDLITDLLSQL